MAYSETWDDGTYIVFHEVPFPVGRKPQIASRRLEGARPGVVRLDDLVATQKTVTDRGIKKYSTDRGELPVVYHYGDRYYISDGHHRLTSLWLKSRKTARVLIVKV